jgi:hypothetical protein
MLRLKTLLLTCIVLAGSAFELIAQTKGQLTALQEIGENSAFREYWGIEKKGDSWSAEAGSDCYIKFVNNIHSKLSAFTLKNAKSNSELINSGFGFIKPNHYTEPSVFHSDRHNLAYVYINGLLYALKNVRDPGNISAFAIEKIYVLMKPEKGEHTSGRTAIKELKGRDHEAVIRQYLSDMKAVQETATAGFTPEIIAEIDAIENKDVADQKAIKDKNDAYWMSAEGQRKLGEMRKEEVTFYNDTGMDIGCCHGQGVSTIIKPGEKKKFGCHSGKVYLGEKVPNSVNLKRTDKLLLDLHGSNCGSVVSVSSVLR